MHQRSSPFGRQTRNSLWNDGVFCAAGLIAFCRCFQSSGWISLPHAVDRYLEACRIDAENPVLTVVPDDIAVDRIPLPGTHLACCQREAAALLALHQPGAGRFQFLGPLRHAAFELLVELLELPRFAIELGEHSHLGSQHLGDHRHRNIVDRAHLIGAEAIDVGQMDCGNEDDCGFLKAGMLANHRRQLEPIELRHANIDEDDRNLQLEQLLERLAGGGGLHEILSELAEDGLVAQQLRRLIVNQQDVNLVVRGHRFSPLPGRLRASGADHAHCFATSSRFHSAARCRQRCSHMRNAESSCSVLTGLAR